MSDMPPLVRGRYRARIAANPADVAAALDLRQRAFRAGQTGQDADAFDARCDHLLIEPCDGGAPVGCVRLLRLAQGAEIAGSYSAQFYGLARLAAYPGPMVEMGRVCVDPNHRPNHRADADILRLVWAALAAFVDHHGTQMLFGCTSFQGVDPAPYWASFAHLEANHAPPPQVRPDEKAPEVVRFADAPAVPDGKRALSTMPGLLRTYLSMGGWVSDHAVVDRDLGTLHVFTALEIGAIPPARARLLRAL